MGHSPSSVDGQSVRTAYLVELEALWRPLIEMRFLCLRKQGITAT